VPARSTWRRALQRLFSTFPGGWPGVGLLLLRVAVGAIIAVQGALYLAGAAAFSVWIAGFLAIASGASLLLGFLTPLGAIFTGVGCAAMTLSWFPTPAHSLIELKLSAILVVTMAGAILLLGPGALSIDARLFGRREIIIPRTAHRPPEL
jgi:uncharacterized membrane protein YphA (DoxX/SURF4 family)